VSTFDISDPRNPVLLTTIATTVVPPWAELAKESPESAIDGHCFPFAMFHISAIIEL
jgi:hypothetical protein